MSIRLKNHLNTSAECKKKKKNLSAIYIYFFKVSATSVFLAILRFCTILGEVEMQRSRSRPENICVHCRPEGKSMVAALAGPQHSSAPDLHGMIWITMKRCL